MDGGSAEAVSKATVPTEEQTQRFPDCDKTGPLFGPNRLKLGVFGLNLSSAAGITAAKDRHEVEWKQNVRLVQLAEKAGFEAVVPVARWRGFEGASNPWGESFETYTWAAGLASVTSRIGIFCTSHVLTVSPVMAAKAMSTIDHISGGRAVLNVVAGWFKKELDMFGVGALDGAARYSYTAEWMNVLLRLWTQDETFDFEGEYITVKDGYQQPKSIQTPRPPVMNAALSPVGHAFAARWADIAFVSIDATNPAAVRTKAQQLRQLAADNGRTIQIWAAMLVQCATTEAAAQDELARYIANGKAIRRRLRTAPPGASPAKHRHRAKIPSSRRKERSTVAAARWSERRSRSQTMFVYCPRQASMACASAGLTLKKACLYSSTRFYLCLNRPAFASLSRPLKPLRAIWLEVVSRSGRLSYETAR